MVDVRERQFLADLLGRRIVPSMRERVMIRTVKFALENEALLSSHDDLAAFLNFARVVFKAKEHGGVTEATAVAVAQKAQLVTWGLTNASAICTKVAVLQGIVC